MSTISGLGSVDYGALVQRATQSRKAQAADVEFKDVGSAEPQRGKAAAGVDEALRDLSETHNLADKMVLDLASGRDLNMHNTMVALEQADIALKYTVQVRNRALSAYEELMRIQV